ncbi:NAD-dependent epimerase/dehydratase family protein [Paenibacillus dokdonensis]|uniref:NmrA family NAD(P)-binding protein n=1 Tax=Paenibacillus dokdonensis TaxID=2567944 RepID=UPI001FE2C09D|nr:NAD-dependent epimerase/dehydratase family protein [Paenibacillus dokdonensis]
MRIFVTGAAGYIGTAVVRELIGAGHQVVCLTRSEKGVQVLDLGAEVARGVIKDLDLLRNCAATSDGVHPQARDWMAWTTKAFRSARLPVSSVVT